MSALVLLIDHERSGRGGLASQLQAAGFQVAQAEDGHRGQALALQANPGLIVTELRLPEIDGLTLIRRLRRDQRTTTPQLVRTPDVLSYGPLTLVPEGYEVLWYGRPVRLTRTEFELLHCLLQRHGQVVPSAVLLREIWGYGPENDLESIRTHIRHLREKLELDSHRPTHIKTIYRSGYCLDLPLDRTAGSFARQRKPAPVGESHDPDCPVSVELPERWEQRSRRREA